jgi:hypothetical protein
MPTFSKRSLLNLEHAHPELRKLMMEAIKKFYFVVTDSRRGRAAQEMAVKMGRSKVHYGDSAHNYSPAVALDIYPYPINYSNTKAFEALQIGIIKPLAHKLGIPIRQGIDWNMNGVLTDDKWDDLPHVELHPWREFAKHSILFDD